MRVLPSPNAKVHVWANPVVPLPKQIVATGLARPKAGATVVVLSKFTAHSIVGTIALIPWATAFACSDFKPMSQAVASAPKRISADHAVAVGQVAMLFKAGPSFVHDAASLSEARIKSRTQLRSEF